jgi:hypothetical protein
MKTEIGTDKLFRRLPAEFITIYDYVQALQFEEEPNYLYIRQ